VPAKRRARPDLPGRGLEVNVHADVGEQRNLAAVGSRDQDAAALLGDRQVGRLDALDVVDRHAVLEGAPHIAHVAFAPGLLGNADDRLLDREVLDIGGQQPHRQQGHQHEHERADDQPHQRDAPLPRAHGRSPVAN
jgi:hypothetical protein